MPYDGSAKIPFVAYHPDAIPAGTVIDQALGCVDFLPTFLRLMGVETLGTEEGRDASALFAGNAPAGWKDITFMRGTHNWICALTNRHKLVYPMRGEPWLFDVEKDPDELTNFFGDPGYSKVVKNLTAELTAYCKEYNDPRLEEPNVKAAMEAAAG